MSPPPKFEGATTGTNVNYGRDESDMLILEIADFLKAQPSIQTLLSNPITLTQNDFKKMKILNKITEQEQGQVDRNEREMDNLILSNPTLYQGIQQIYQRHNVTIPSQRTIDKAEVIDAKIKIIKEALEIT